MHARESRRYLYRAPLLLPALTQVDLHLHGERDQPLDLRSHQNEERRLWVLSDDHEDSVELNADLVAADPRPITLVVSEGSQRTKKRAPNRVPGLAQALRVRLPTKDPKASELASASALSQSSSYHGTAQALGIIEGTKVLTHLLETEEKLFPPPTTTEAAVTSASEDEALTLLYQDEFFVAVAKPSGRVVHRGWGREANPLLQSLRDQLGRLVYPLHRLDRATSGVVLFALDRKSARAGQQLFETGAIRKEYLAVCRGHQLVAQTLNHPLKSPVDGQRKEASTEFRLLAHFERYGLVHAVPHTGRTHQIRRHLKHLAHPIIGDVRYGKGEHNRLFKERFGFARLALHARRQSFTHPLTGQAIEIEAPLPGDMARLFELLGWTPLLEIESGDQLG